jgi:ubiquinone/menaquinone biosynthesis C-methylase UbiE
MNKAEPKTIHLESICSNNSQEMLARANKNKDNYNTKNVEFVESRITGIALESGIADCIISNCVVNLVPEADKPHVFDEMFRLLKPGGRVAISDILARKPLPDEMRANMALYCGCIAGASQVQEYKDYLQQAGFRGRCCQKRSGSVQRAV